MEKKKKKEKPQNFAYVQDSFKFLLNPYQYLSGSHLFEDLIHRWAKSKIVKGKRREKMKFSSL